MKLINRNRLFALLITLTAIGVTNKAVAGDVDMKMTTTDGTTRITFQDSGAVEVSSINSNGDAYFNSITQVGTGGNIILNQNTLQTGATFYVSSGTVNNQLRIGNILTVGSGGANTDNYIAFPLIANAALSAKQVVIINTNGRVGTTTTASSVTVAGITVTAASGAGDTVYVATQGILTGVTCQTAVGTGIRTCTGTVAGQIGTCASATNDGVSIGKMISGCLSGGTGTVLLNQQ